VTGKNGEGMMGAVADTRKLFSRGADAVVLDFCFVNVSILFCLIDVCRRGLHGQTATMVLYGDKV
jgi:hypothetical protein